MQAERGALRRLIQSVGHAIVLTLLILSYDVFFYYYYTKIVVVFCGHLSDIYSEKNENAKIERPSGRVRI